MRDGMWRDGHERGEKGGGSTCSRLDGHESSQQASMTRSHVLSSLNIGTCTLTHAASSLDSSSSCSSRCAPPPGSAWWPVPPT